MMDVTKEMATTYADCVKGGHEPLCRRLTWHADTTVLLAHAPDAYYHVGGYGAFHPGIVSDLAFAFRGKGIEVICGRENSVVMYVLIPHFLVEAGTLAEDVFTFAKEEMSADEVNFVEKIWCEADDARHFGDSKLLRIWWD